MDEVLAGVRQHLIIGDVTPTPEVQSGLQTCLRRGGPQGFRIPPLRKSKSLQKCCNSQICPTMSFGGDERLNKWMCSDNRDDSLFSAYSSYQLVRKKFREQTLTFVIPVLFSSYNANSVWSAGS